MSASHTPSATGAGRQRTQAGGLPLPSVAPTPPRVQPPLREVLEGLDARELEGETVFDQLFGNLGTAQRRGR